MDAGNLHLRAIHPQSHQGVCADAVATIEGITREDVDRLGYESQQRASSAIRGGHFDRSLVPVYREDGSLALDREEYPRPQTTLEGLAGLKPAFTAVADYPLDDKGTTYRNLICRSTPASTSISCTMPATRQVSSMARPHFCWRRRTTPMRTV
jgi:acetyl-CoA C-acetyltransferase